MSKDHISLRTTIPVGVREPLNLKEGDTLGWNIELRNNKLIATIEKIE